MAKAKIILYKQKTLTDGTHPVMLQVIHQRAAKRHSLKISCLPEQWNEETATFNKSFPGYIQANKKLDKIKATIHLSMDRFELEGTPFTVDKFFSNLGSKSRSKPVLGTFEELIERFVQEGRIGNSMIYKDTMNTLKRYVNGRTPTFHDIDYRFLVGFESYMRSTGYRDSGIHLRMRTLRAVYNEAIRLQYITIEYYPFSRSKADVAKYSLNRLTITRNIRGLVKEDIDKVKQFDTSEYPKLAQSKLLFLFSYFVNGMNFSDIAYLKWENCKHGRIKYRRQKTKLWIDVKITEPIGEILEHFGRISSSDYVFPILNDTDHSNPVSKKNRIKKSLKRLNLDLNKIGELLGIELKITSYVSRHTFSQVLQAAGTSEEAIQNVLGHKSGKTTKTYLKDLDGSRYDHLSNVL